MRGPWYTWAVAYDEDGGKSVVAELGEVTGARFWDGRCVVRDAEPAKVLRCAGGWATVLVSVQDALTKERGWAPTRYVLQRWRRAAGAWRRVDTFNLTAADLAALRSACTPTPSPTA